MGLQTNIAQEQCFGLRYRAKDIAAGAFVKQKSNAAGINLIRWNKFCKNVPGTQLETKDCPKLEDQEDRFTRQDKFCRIIQNFL